MLKEVIITTLFRGIPEGFIHMFGVCAFSEEKINKQKYVVCSVILAIIMVFVRALPISYGIHTLILLMCMIGISLFVNKISIISSISIVIFNMIIQLLAEGINVILIEYILDVNLAEAFSNPIRKVIYGIPSLIIFGSVIFLTYKLISKKQRKQDV